MGSRERNLILAVILGFNAAAYAQSKTRQEDEPDRRIVISIPHRKLALVEDGQVVRLYDTAVGARKSPTPVGNFAIANRITNPTYYTPGKVTPPGKANPLGTRWLGLTAKGFGIHGTNVPTSIGKAASHGCIRMRNRDVEELFELVSVGDRVELHGQPDEEVVALFGELPRPAARPAAVEKKQPAASVSLALAVAAK